MSKKKKDETFSPDKATKEIIKRLDRLTGTGNRPDAIFADWVKMSKATLEALPGYFEAALTKQPHPDNPATTALFEQLRKKYKGSYWDNLCEAFAILLNSTQTYQDTIGNIYMGWAWVNKKNGQYFTPYPIAKLMALIPGIEEDVRQRLKEAIYKDPVPTAALLAGGAITDPLQKEAWLIARVILYALPHYKTLPIIEPACGSGVMFLAVADSVPSWATQMGLIQFYGIDNDPFCTLMCQTNVLLYGLNGVRAKQLVWLAEQTLAGNIQERVWSPPVKTEPTSDKPANRPLTPLDELVASLPPRPVPRSPQVRKEKKAWLEQLSFFKAGM
jgi:type I restriction-modification system DNA methylase subunit